VIETLSAVFSLKALFLALSLLGLLAALGTVLARNLVHAALYLVGFFFVIACQFVLLEAEFLAAIQVLVYIGAVAILLMFGIMLTRNVQGDDTTSVAPGWIAPALVVALALFFVLKFGIDNHVGLRDRAGVGHGAWADAVRRPPLDAPATPDGPLPWRTAAVNDMGRVVGAEMLNRYAVPFEVAGLLLTAALVGAIALAHRDAEEDRPARASGTPSVATRTPPPANGHGPASSPPLETAGAPASGTTAGTV
jgi:NADH-quinone oxidoreductase subunit J